MKDNTERKRYELEENGLVTFADYKLEGNTLYIRHIEAPVAARGTGSASRLMQAIAENAKTNNYKIVPICGYAGAWLRKHKEYSGLAL